MRQALLLAHPAGHSLSPRMHNAAFEARGIDAVYRAVDVPPVELGARVAELRRDDMFGANVTIPHKEAVIPLLERLSDAAKAIGAVNTIANQNGELLGENTDAGGFLRALAEGGISVRGTDAVVLGAGGAARAVVYALLTAGAGNVHVFNRTPSRAARLAAELAEFGVVRVVSEPDLGMVGRASNLLVNATSVGMAGTGSFGDMPCPPDAIPDGGAVVDIVYRPALTPLLREAGRRGAITQNGVAMLVHQGAAAFEQWTGETAPVDVMRAALEDALAAG
jgi:shikimate dehydrogenase